MKRFICTMLVLLAAPSARADDSVPLFYTRDALTIMRHVDPLPWQDGQTEQSGIRFDVEVRDAMSFYNQKDWFNLAGPTDDSGVLLVFEKPVQSPIIASKQYAPLDILFLDAQGRISQIVPNILLSNLSQQIVPQNPVLAFLFVKGGICEQFSIKPGDTVDYRIFNKLPVVLGDPVAIIDAPKTVILSGGKPVNKAPAKTPAAPTRMPAHMMPPPLPPTPPAPTVTESDERRLEHIMERHMDPKPDIGMVLAPSE